MEAITTILVIVAICFLVATFGDLKITKSTKIPKSTVSIETSFNLNVRQAKELVKQLQEQINEIEYRPVIIPITQEKTNDATDPTTPTP